MPIWKVTIRKGLVAGGHTDEDWTNVYHLDAVGPEDAYGFALDILGAESSLHSTAVKFKTLNLQDTSHTFNGRSFSVPGTGARTPGTNMQPLWNTGLVVFNDLEAGRPELKYMRPPLYEEDVVGQELSSTMVGDLETFGDDILAITGICGPRGEALTDRTVRAATQMRQTNWHRKGRPGFHRGYVAN